MNIWIPESEKNSVSSFFRDISRESYISHLHIWSTSSGSNDNKMCTSLPTERIIFFSFPRSTFFAQNIRIISSSISSESLSCSPYIYRSGLVSFAFTIRNWVLVLKLHNEGRVKIYGVPGPGPSTGRGFFRKKGTNTLFSTEKAGENFFQINFPKTRPSTQ